MFFGGGVKLFQGKPLKISRVLLEIFNWVIPGKQTNYWTLIVRGQGFALMIEFIATNSRLGLL